MEKHYWLAKPCYEPKIWVFYECSLPIEKPTMREWDLIAFNEAKSEQINAVRENDFDRFYPLCQKYYGLP